MEEKNLTAKTETVELIQITVAQQFIDPIGIVADLRNKYGGLIITDPKDKAQVKAVKDAKASVYKERVDINKRKKEIITKINDFKKEIDQFGTAAFEGLKKLHEELSEKLESAKKTVEDEAKAAETAKLEAYTEKFNKLQQAGWLSNGVQLVIGNLIIEHTQIDEFSDADVEEWIQKGLAENERIQALLSGANEVVKDVNVQEEPAVKEEEVIVSETPGLGGTFLDEVIVGQKPNPIAEPAQKEGVKEPMAPIAESAIPAAAEPKDDHAYIPEGFLVGWNAHRNAVQIFFKNAPRMTREDLLAGILALKPEGDGKE